MTYFDIVAPSFGIGTCWTGFVKLAYAAYKPLRDFLEIPKLRTFSYAMIFGYPSYHAKSIPRRNRIDITWK
jgi:nitroreductase